MFICQKCHQARQARDAYESQPLQHTEVTWEPTGQRVNCPDCSQPTRGKLYEYLNAHELVCELVELRSTMTDRSAVTFPLDYYADAADMLAHRELNGQPYTQEEARAILQYAAELEEKGE